MSVSVKRELVQLCESKSNTTRRAWKKLFSSHPRPDMDMDISNVLICTDSLSVGMFQLSTATETTV